MSQNNDGNRNRMWTGSRIKCLPYVENTYIDKRGNKRKRSVDDMIRRLKRRLSKSGIPEKAAEAREFTKPSVDRREAKKRRQYEIEKSAKRKHEAALARGDRTTGKHQRKKLKSKKNR